MSQSNVHEWCSVLTAPVPTPDPLSPSRLHFNTNYSSIRRACVGSGMPANSEYHYIIPQLIVIYIHLPDGNKIFLSSVPGFAMKNLSVAIKFYYVM